VRSEPSQLERTVAGCTGLKRCSTLKAYSIGRPMLLSYTAYSRFPGNRFYLGNSDAMGQLLVNMMSPGGQQQLDVSHRASF
jgi:hypothetical protein